MPNTGVFNNIEMESWLSSLDFYKNEIVFWGNHLTKVVARNTSHDILAQSEHFQNQFIIHLEHIDILHHDVKAFENILEKETGDRSPESDKDMKATEIYLRERMKTFEHIYIDLKHDYFSFLAKYL